MKVLSTITELTQEQIDANFAAVVTHETPEVISFYATLVQNPNIPGIWNETPIQKIFRNEAVEKFEIARAVLIANPDVNVVDVESGRTPVMEAMNRKYQGAALVLIKVPQTDLAAKDKEGNGLLMYAVQTGSEEVVEQLLKRGCPYFVNQNGEGPLLAAVKQGQPEIIAALVEGAKKAGIDFKMWDDYKKACEIAQSDVVMKDVLQGGVLDKNKHVSLSKTVGDILQKTVHLSKSDKEWVLLAIGISEKDSPDKPIEDLLDVALFNQVNYGTVHDVRLLLQVGANPNATKRFAKQTVLLEAITSTLHARSRTGVDIVLDTNAPYRKAKLLIHAGADITRGNDVGDLPLLQSMVKNRLGITSLLLHYGAPLVKNKDGNGPLKFAAGCDSPNGIHEILRYGGDINEVGPRGKRALYWAVYAGKPENVMALWEHGFKMDFSSEEGRDILKMASERKNEWIIPAVKKGINGQDILLNQEEKEAAQEQLYQDILLACQQKYTVGMSSSFTEPKTLAQKLETLNSKQVDVLTRVMGVKLDPPPQTHRQERAKKREKLEGIRSFFRRRNNKTPPDERPLPKVPVHTGR